MEFSLRLNGEKGGSVEIKDLDGKGPFHYGLSHIDFHGPSEHKI